MAAAVLGVGAAWFFTRCAGMPDDRCIANGIGPEAYFHEGCLICICDAAGELHCNSGNCSPDAGSARDSIGADATEPEVPWRQP